MIWGRTVLVAAAVGLAFAAPAAEATRELDGVHVDHNRLLDAASGRAYAERFAAGGSHDLRTSLNVDWAIDCSDEDGDGAFDDVGGGRAWETSDRLVQNAADAGISLTASVSAWPAPCFLDPDEDGRIVGRPIRNRLMADRIWREVVDRYKPGGTYWSMNGSQADRPVSRWEVGNEPNLPPFWNHDEPVDAADYTAYLCRSEREISAADPASTVIVGGLSSEPSQTVTVDGDSRRSYVDDMYRSGAKPCFDEMGWHPYADWRRGAEGTGDLVRDMRQEIDENGDSAWLSATEWGWGTRTDRRQQLDRVTATEAEWEDWGAGDPVTNGTRLSDDQGAIESRQAELLAATIRDLKARRSELRLAQANIYYAQDAPDDEGRWSESSGLFRERAAGGDPKPAWASVAREFGGEAGAGPLP